jgi:hypothetical protein
VNPADERALRDRFSGLVGPADGDWREVERRARRRLGIRVLVAVVALVLAAAGLAVGGKVIGVFDVEGKRIPLASLSAQEKELLVTSLCRHVFLRVVPGKAPEQVCRDGNPTIEQIANDGSVAHYRIRYPWGVTCLASGPAHHRTLRTLSCNVGSPNHKLVPTPKQPITVDDQFAMTPDRSFLRITKLSGLAGVGVARVELVARDGSSVATDVRGNAYSFKTIPDRFWVSIRAIDNAGSEVYREPVHLEIPPSLSLSKSPPRISFPEQPARPAGRPLQHAATPVASADVYRNGVVAIRFASTASDAYRRLARRRAVGIDCGKVAYGAGRWQELAAGFTPRFGPEVRMRMNGRYGGMPSPPFDYCQLSGMYGRYWNDEEGTHELVEVPFTALGARYLDERATARDLAYLVRNKKMWPIRNAIQRGEPPPSAEAIAHIFGSRIEPLANRGDAPSAKKVGVWTGKRIIVASERAPDGRLLFVTMNGTRIGANNIRDLSFPF